MIKSIKGIPYKFKAKVWRYDGPNGWFFVSLPLKISKEIRTLLKSEEEGWGRLKATAKIGDSEWKTAIWFDTKQNTYLLPLKAEVRMKESIQEGQDVELTVWI
jgi:hypothetical protein